MSASKKKNFTLREKAMLLEILKTKKHIIENKKTDAVSAKMKKLAWTEIAQIFNNSGIINESASSEQLRRLWQNLKCRQRDAITKERQFRMGTGGGMGIPDTMVDPDILELTPALLVEIPGANDSDGTAAPPTQTEFHTYTPELNRLPTGLLLDYVGSNILIEPAGSGSLTETAGSGSLTETAGSGSLTESASSGSLTATGGSDSLTELAGAGSLAVTAGSSFLTVTAGSSRLSAPAGSTSLTEPAASRSLTEPAGSTSVNETAGSTSLTEPADSNSVTEPPWSNNERKLRLQILKKEHMERERRANYTTCNGNKCKTRKQFISSRLPNLFGPFFLKKDD